MSSNNFTSIDTHPVMKLPEDSPVPDSQKGSIHYCLKMERGVLADMPNAAPECIQLHNIKTGDIFTWG